MLDDGIHALELVVFPMRVRKLLDYEVLLAYGVETLGRPCRWSLVWAACLCQLKPSTTNLSIDF